MRLSHKDFVRLEQAIFELYEFRDLERFRQEVPAILLKLMPSVYCFWTDFAVDSVASRQTPAGRVESHSRATPELVKKLKAGLRNQPFTEYSIKGDEETALKLSGFLGHVQFRASAIHYVYREHGLRFKVRVSVNRGPGKAAGVGVLDGKRVFTQRDRLVLNLLRRHFNRAHRNAKLATARLAGSTKSLLAYGLTPRETAVAQWLAGGKTNPEIALILRCGTRTIEKHMERILEKLGVENRAAAAVAIASAERG